MPLAAGGILLHGFDNPRAHGLDVLAAQAGMQRQRQQLVMQPLGDGQGRLAPAVQGKQVVRLVVLSRGNSLGVQRVDDVLFASDRKSVV